MSLRLSRGEAEGESETSELCRVPNPRTCYSLSNLYHQGMRGFKRVATRGNKKCGLCLYLIHTFGPIACIKSDVRWYNYIYIYMYIYIYFLDSTYTCNNCYNTNTEGLTVTSSAVLSDFTISLTDHSFSRPGALSLLLADSSGSSDKGGTHCSSISPASLWSSPPPPSALL